MTTISSVALGLNGGCCFAYAVLFGLMQTRLLEMYGVEAGPRARLFVTPSLFPTQQSRPRFIPPSFDDLASLLIMTFLHPLCCDPSHGLT